MVLGQLLQQAAARGIGRLIGTYRPSGRNGIVADHYAKLGFVLASEDSEGSQTWKLPVDGAGAGDTAALFAAAIAEGFGKGDAIP
jgi:predicted enzyme involved in methoxymalonyl-ACP biosynthesis